MIAATRSATFLAVSDACDEGHKHEAPAYNEQQQEGGGTADEASAAARVSVAHPAAAEPGKYRLNHITELTISDCTHITSIPLVQLVELRWLFISYCDELRRMECLGLLKSLEQLKIVGCPKLVQLDVEDEQAGTLSSLRKLCVDNTAVLKMFPLRNSLSFITELGIASCSEEVIFEEAMQSLTADERSNLIMSYIFF
ncbi:hypothetical protein ZIOFF_004766 [Zingiber officinale]|uniref:Uncharacterized protein n=1 Tax=Zingiber officinale TaxID=94328 RepID=A0A8J5M121_ZINOF|nr:hypothetical protein ZIOFF_004766 [Zingiber officinale]